MMLWEEESSLVSNVCFIHSPDIMIIQYILLLPNPLYKNKLNSFDYLHKSELNWHAMFEMHVM